MRAINASVMRQVNQTLLLNRIRTRPISRAELAEETGLTRASVTQIVEELINAGLVIETSMVESSRLGRRSTQLAINPGAGYVFGVMMRPLGCTVGTTDMLGRTLVQNLEITNGREPGDVLDSVAQLIEAQRVQMGAREDQIFGVGVSVPGMVDMRRGTVVSLPLMEKWNGVNLRAELEARTGFEVHLENAANAQALEQKYFGGAGNSFALLRLEDSLSVGVVVQDELYRGAPEFAVELGQCPANAEGTRTLNDLLADGMEMRLNAESDRGVPSERMLELSYPLANVMCVYQVKHAILGGRIGERMGPLLDELVLRTRALLPEPARDCASISIAATDPVRMAVAAAYHRVFSV